MCRNILIFLSFLCISTGSVFSMDFDIPDYNPRDLKEVQKIWQNARITPSAVNDFMVLANQMDGSKFIYIFSPNKEPHAVFNAKNKTITTYLLDGRQIKLTQDQLIKLLKE